VKLDEFLKSKEVGDVLAELIELFAEQSKSIRKGFLGRTEEVAGTINIYDEEQMALDKWADEVIINALKETKLVHWVASEEQPEVIEVSDAKSDYGVTLDPLDGSSLIPVNLAVGTIVGIYPGHVFQPGENMLAAMYFLYGPLTTLTLSIKSKVHDFVLDNNNEYLLQKENLTIPDAKIYAPGALRRDWLPEHAEYINQLEAEGYKLRFSGSFAADVHQILHKGGLFTYPAYKGKETGKLRLLFEANPMGKIVTDAGGAVSNGKQNLLKTTPTAVSNRTPIYVGGKKEIKKIEEIMNK
jgi:fructose-1,6-bisphosphatase I